MRNHYYLPLVERNHQNRVNTKQGNLVLARHKCLPMFSALGLFFLCSKGIIQYLRGDKNTLTNWDFLLNTNRRVEKRKTKKLCPGFKPSLNCLPPLHPRWSWNVLATFKWVRPVCWSLGVGARSEGRDWGQGFGGVGMARMGGISEVDGAVDRERAQRGRRDGSG